MSSLIATDPDPAFARKPAQDDSTRGRVRSGTQGATPGKAPQNRHVRLHD